MDGDILDNDTSHAATVAHDSGRGGSSQTRFGTTNTNTSVGTASASAATKSFEDDDDRFYVVYNAGESIGAWDIVEGSVDPFRVAQPTLAPKWRDTGAQAPSGEKILDLNGNEPGAIETELRVARNAPYTLSFLASENHFCDGATTADGRAKSGRVLWNGEEVATFDVDTDFGEFDVVTAQLPPNGERVGVLRIESTTPGSCGPAIESASVTVDIN